MILLGFAAFVACSLLVAAASSCKDADETLPNLLEAGDFAIGQGWLEVDGVRVSAASYAGAPVEADDAGDGGVGGGVPAGAGVLQFVVSVRAPAGSWPVTVAAQGTLGVAASSDAGGSSVRTFTSDGSDSFSIIVPVFVANAGGGEAVVQVSLANATQSFAFFVVPTSDSAETACIAAFDAEATSCAPDTVSPATQPEVDGGADAGITDGGEAPTATVSAVSDGSVAFQIVAPPCSYFAGEGVYVFVDEGDGAADARPPLGETWNGAVTTTGSLALVIDGGLASSEAVALTQGVTAPLLPAQFTSAGVGTVAIQVGAGTVNRKTYVSCAPVVEPLQASVVGSVTTSATDILTVCTSASSGSITAAVVADAGTVTTPTVQIGAPGGSCPADLPGQASFTWTGTQPFPIWTFSLGDGGIVSVVRVQMAGLPLTPPTSTNCIAVASPTKVLEWIVIPPPPATTVEGGAGAPASTDPTSWLGTLVVDLQFDLLNCMDGGADSGTDGGGSPFSKATVSITGTGGLTSTTPTVMTDSTGSAVIELRGPAVAIDEATAVITYPGANLATVSGRADGGV